MPEEEFEGQDAGDVFENLEDIEDIDLRQNQPDENDEKNVIDEAEAGFPPLEHDDAGNFNEEANQPENIFDVLDFEDDLELLDDVDASPQEHTKEEHMEDLDLPQNQHDEENVIDEAEAGFPPLEHDERDDAGIFNEEANQPENIFDVLDIEDDLALLEDVDASPQEHTKEEHMEDLDLPQNQPDEKNVIDEAEAGFPPLEHDKHDDAGNFNEEANQPEDNFDVLDVEDNLELPKDADAPPQEHTKEEHMEDLDLLQNQPDEKNVIDEAEAGFPPLEHDDAGNFNEEANPPEDNCDVLDVEDNLALLEDVDAPPQEHTKEVHMEDLDLLQNQPDENDEKNMIDEAEAVFPPLEHDKHDDAGNFNEEANQPEDILDVLDVEDDLALPEDADAPPQEPTKEVHMEDLDLLQNQPDENDEAEAGFPPLEHDDAGNFNEEANPPENIFDVLDVEDNLALPKDADAPPQEHMEDLDLLQNQPDENDEKNVIDEAEAGFPPLEHDEHDDAENFNEEANQPEDNLALREDADAPPQEHTKEEHHDVGVEAAAAVNFGPPEKQGAEDDSKGTEIEKWPGWPGQNIFRILIPEQMVGRLIGPNGKRIKKITQETKSRIKVLRGPPEIDLRAVLISAKEEPDRSIPPAVEGLLRVHKLVVYDDHDPADSAFGAGRTFITKLLVPDNQAGSLIGPGGADITDIRDDTGCSITIRSGSAHVPVFALRNDSLVEITGESAGVHKAVELIALHLRKYLVDSSIVGVIETEMERPSAPVPQNVPPPQHPHPHPHPHPPFAPVPQNVPPPQHYHPHPPSAPVPQNVPPPQHYHPHPPPPPYPHPSFAPVPQNVPPPQHCHPHHHHQGPPPAYARDTYTGNHSSSAQRQQSVVVTKNMQIPVACARTVIGRSGENISHIRRASGARITIEETIGVSDEMTAEICGTASQVQAAEQLVENAMIEVALERGYAPPPGYAFSADLARFL